jgi:hypothetical protein
MITRTGGIQSISLCHSIRYLDAMELIKKGDFSCFDEGIVTTTPEPGIIEKAFPGLFKKDSLAYRDYIPLVKDEKGQYSVQVRNVENFFTHRHYLVKVSLRSRSYSPVGKKLPFVC